MQKILFLLKKLKIIVFYLKNATDFLEASHSPRFLCLYGTKKIINQTQNVDENQILKEDPSYTMQYWPITQLMLKDALDA